MTQLIQIARGLLTGALAVGALACACFALGFFAHVGWAAMSFGWAFLP